MSITQASGWVAHFEEYADGDDIIAHDLPVAVWVWDGTRVVGYVPADDAGLQPAEGRPNFTRYHEVDAEEAT
jgi:hypothetical protein